MVFNRYLPMPFFVCAIIATQSGCSSEDNSTPEQTILEGQQDAGYHQNGTYTVTTSGSDTGDSNSTNPGSGTEDVGVVPDSGTTSTDTRHPGAGFEQPIDSGRTIPSVSCGNGQIDTGEECENAIPITATCESLGRGTGVVTCNATCRYELSGCEISPVVTDSGVVSSDVFDVNHETSSAIGTVGIVTWTASVDPISEAHIEFGLDTNYGMAAPVDINDPQHRTLLLGMKALRDYHFRIVARSGGEEYISQDYMLTTGAASNLVQSLELNVDNEGARARGFIVATLFQGAGGGRFGGSGGGGMAFIVDADGDVVWWYSSSLDHLARARMSYDGKNMWMGTEGNTFNNQIERVSMDGLDSQTYPVQSTHDLTAVTGDVMAIPRGGFNDCVVITEITPDGNTRDVFDTRTVFSNGRCHANALRYSETEGLYTLSDLSAGDIIFVDRETGQLKHRLSEFGFVWGSRQHGHHLLDSSIVVFNNGMRIAQEIYLDRSTMYAEEIWRYSSEYNSQTFGDVQRLPNGNTMVTYSTAGRTHEVGPDSNRIMEIRFNSAVGYTLWRESLYGPPADIAL